MPAEMSAFAFLYSAIFIVNTHIFLQYYPQIYSAKGIR